MLTHDGAVLLDFGLARLAVATSGDGATATVNEPITRAGAILGTVQYMAPAQLEGRVIDPRTDIFALGAVLYEMVSGRRAFTGTSTASLIGNILHTDPPLLTTLEALSPPALDRVVQKCLAKDAIDRWQSAAEVEARLDALQDVTSDDGAPALLPGAGGRRTVAPAPSKRRWALIAVGTAACLTIAAAAWLYRSTSSGSMTGSEPLAPAHRSLTRLTFDAGVQTDPTFSPDGRFIAYASDKSGNFDIWVQPIAGGNAVQVTKSPAADTQPSWSPDGGIIAFRSERDGGGLYLVPALGGQERLLVNEGNNPTWSRDGKEIWYFSDSLMQHDIRLKAIAASGGVPRGILPGLADLAGRWFWIAAHPDGRFSFMGWHPDNGLGFFTASEDGKVVRSEIKRNLPSQLSRFLNGGLDTVRKALQLEREWHGLILETLGDNGASNLWRVGVDPKTLEWTTFDQLTTGPGADVNSALSTDGRHVLFTTLRTSVRAWWFPLDPHNGLTLPGKAVTEEQAEITGLSASHDGRVLVFNFLRVGSPKPSLWRQDLSSDVSEPIDAGNGGGGILSPNGEFVAYSREGRTEGSVRLFSPTSREASQGRSRRWPPNWSAACDWNSNLTEVLVSHGPALEAWPVAASEPPIQSRVIFKLKEPDAIFQARLSPNGRWLAFVAAQNTRNVVGVTSEAGPPDRSWAPVATDFAWIDKPRWARDGRTLFFLAQQGLLLNLWGVGFDPNRGTTIGEPYPVAQFNSPAFCIDPRLAQADVDVSEGGIFLPMRSASGNIWMLDNVDR